MMFYSVSCFDCGEWGMKLLSQYGLMAENHWREFCPKMVAHLEAKGC